MRPSLPWTAIALRRFGSGPISAAVLRGPVACVDLETTGGMAAQHRVIEVGIVLLDEGAVVEEWSSLVNPGQRIPASIVQFTGIDDDMVAEAPSFADLRQEIRSRLDGRIFVAHNASFDFGFLRSEFQRAGERFAAPVLCTVRLSRALFPEQRRHNLDALIERHGLACDARHRALGDARVLPALLAAMQTRVGQGRLDEAAATLIRATSLPPELPAGLADELPDGPGVYLFRGEGGMPIYVGKGRNLRSRVLGHFAARHVESGEARLARQVRKVEWIETGGEFGALLLESRLIKELAPVANRRLRSTAGAYCIRLRAAETGTVAPIEPIDADALDGESEAYGPFRSAHTARRALEGKAREAGLCLKLLGLESGEGSCFARQLGRCRGACVGLESRAVHDARVRLVLAAMRLQPWPFAGAVGIREPAPGSNATVLHVIDRWRHLGSAQTEDELQALLRPGGAADFDVNTYRIIARCFGRLDSRRCVPLARRGQEP